MTSNAVVELVDDPHAPGAGPPAPHAGGPRPRRRRRIALWLLAALTAVVAVAALWFFLGRAPAEQVGDSAALEEFRATADGSADTAGRPPAGVYAATASGTESVGIPGFDERLGPNAPVTVTHGADGCFTYRADLNSLHWRSWTFCPSPTATFALVGLESWTARTAPGLDIETLSTYSCDQPVDLLWAAPTDGERRTGACTGTNDTDAAVTADAATVEVVGGDSLRVGGEDVDVVRLRTTDVITGDQTGTETGEWWLDATTGLPVRMEVASELSGGSGDYAETIRLRLDTLTPAT